MSEMSQMYLYKSKHTLCKRGRLGGTPLPIMAVAHSEPSVRRSSDFSGHGRYMGVFLFLFLSFLFGRNDGPVFCSLLKSGMF